MPRRKIGHIEKSPGGGWDVRVSRGYRADGKRRTVCEHVDGSFEDACSREGARAISLPAVIRFVTSR